MLCYCCSKKPFIECCAPYLLEGELAPNCEALMRSRYTAYCRGQIDYVYHTTHPTQRSAELIEEIQQFADSVHFFKLAISASNQNMPKGEVSFKAYFIIDNTVEVITEQSFFEFIDKWYYHSGKLSATPSHKLKRNELCPCGSLIKVKHCQTHLRSGQA
ncbi:YchJ family protein [Rheinheimera sp. UJ63]|uniref:YchJ family protein n=1 Tax=Rheinheimera sp. UJ63 TaxID=2910157 RepID=UPI001F35DF31|nr:YchJ family metal-binding protein [Rheinheimera sp. UJ63]MCF4009747.1 hypothetical protein [Rheinheimera sp. UJ63]